MFAALAITLGGCATSGSAPLGRDLPPKPAYAVPVTVPEPQEHEDARLVAARERAGRIENGRRLAAFGSWYGDLVGRVSGSP